MAVYDIEGIVSGLYGHGSWVDLMDTVAGGLGPQQTWTSGSFMPQLAPLAPFNPQVEPLYGSLSPELSGVGMPSGFWGTGGTAGFSPELGTVPQPMDFTVGMASRFALPVDENLWREQPNPADQQAGGGGGGGGGAVYNGVHNGVIGAPAGSIYSRPNSNWNTVNRWDQQILAAANALGIDAKHLKATVAMESEGNENSAQGTATSGLTHAKPEIWGELLGPAGYNVLDGPYDHRNPEHQLLLAAAVLRNHYEDARAACPNCTEEEVWFQAHASYLSPAGECDSYNGRCPDQYAEEIQGMVDQLADAEMRGTASAAPPGPQGGPRAEFGTPNAFPVQDIVHQAVGKPYVWSGTPGRGAPPGNWDCSGFTYWVNQNYGDGSLVQGSHYQYEQMRNEGRLITDKSQLQPGDLVFFDTGSRAGAGANLNGASHVGIYIGDGQMVHASNPTQGTLVSDINSSYYGPKFIGGGRMGYSGGGRVASGPTTGRTTQSFEDMLYNG